MSVFPKPSSPLAAFRDLAAFMRQRSREQVIGGALAVLVTTIIVILFLVAAGTVLGTVGVVLLGYRRLFNARHQFLYGMFSGTDSANARFWRTNNLMEARATGPGPSERKRDERVKP